MKYFIDNLIEKIEEKNSRICVGLDPHLNLMPASVLDSALLKNPQENQKEIAEAILYFNKEIIEATAEHTAVVKPQMAFYEKLGTAGMETLWKTINYAWQKGLLVLLDGKRNDIGSTAKAYAEAYLHVDSGADSLTINPYLGRDGITPFLEDKTKGAFALLKTSNPSSADIQDLKLNNGKKVYEAVALFLAKIAEDYLGKTGYSNLAAVVGATYPKELAEIRALIPSIFFLIPGYGAQGGGAKDVKAAFDKQGRGAVINSSRGINFAYRKEEYKDLAPQNFGKAAALAAKKMKNDINSVLDL
ncbi:orotidine-5'-phosphate decarboxylase [Halanaerobium hydrogeniformans]|uniref:Orotidine 5'-phosphate decarboxylase n=1 Tax=Halanaerobium hydrogeniformans TaxID=656519 RepID=E4RIV9_HALHG|nr:orotidine-5'-phosphate decarboxylase [Halanaerobium hydrogeniformans]ADQ15179.1 orotidine 5'-phosphate decarboxylase [Halanaerobium hydrogeniformans]